MSPESKRTNKLARIIKGFKFPKHVVGEAENKEVSPSESKLIRIVDRFERAWRSLGFEEPRSERKFGDCNNAPEILGYVALDEGRRHGYNVAGGIYQLGDLHSRAGGDPDKAFRHGFNIMTIDNQPYIVDVTFSQFLGSDGYLKPGYRKAQDTTGIENANPLVEELIHKGYVSLNNANLQEYVRISSLAEDKSYAKNISIELLSTIKTMPIPVDLIEKDGVTPDIGLAQR